MVSSDTEKAMPAKVMVAPATVLSTARALSTVEVSPSGSLSAPEPMELSSRMPSSPSTIAAMTKSIGTTKRLPRTRSANADAPSFIGPKSPRTTAGLGCRRS